MKKRTLSVIALIVALLFVLAACDTPGTTTTPNQPATQGTPATGPAGNADTDDDEDEPAGIDFPTREITIYNSSAAGSPADIMARQLALSVEEITGQRVTVVNATGGGGGVMFGSVMGQPTDGYTWGSFTAGQIITLQAGLYRDFPMENFTWVSNIQVDHFGLFLSTDSPWNNLDEMVAWAQENPGQLQMGGQGTGSGQHLSALQLAYELDFDFVWVPFDGIGEIASALLGGHVQVISGGPGALRPYVEAGQAIMLNSTGVNRPFPDTPTNDELGIYQPFTQYRGIFVQTGVDPQIVRAISNLVREATLSDSFVEYMNSIYMEDAFMDYTEYPAFVMADFAYLASAMENLLN